MTVYVLSGYHIDLEWREVEAIFRTREAAVECMDALILDSPDDRFIYDIEEFEVQ